MKIRPIPQTYDHYLGLRTYKYVKYTDYAKLRKDHVKTTKDFNQACDNYVALYNKYKENILELEHLRDSLKQNG